MKSSPVIQRVRSQCASFSDRVFGAVEFNFDFGEDRIAVPSCYVITGFNAGQSPQTAGVVTQRLDDDVSLLLCVDATTDDFGKGASDQVEDLMEEIWPALIGWVPAEGYGGLFYQGGAPISSSRARYWYEMNFSDFRIIG